MCRAVNEEGVGRAHRDRMPYEALTTMLVSKNISPLLDTQYSNLLPGKVLDSQEQQSDVQLSNLTLL